IQVAQKKVKIAFENVDSSSRGELIPSKIKERRISRSLYGLHQNPKWLHKRGVLVAEFVDGEQFVTKEITKEGNRWPNIEVRTTWDRKIIGLHPRIEERSSYTKIKEVRMKVSQCEEGKPDLPLPFPESFHEQTDEELTKNDIKRIDAYDQAIQTILLGFLEDVYAAVDSCETANEIWERVRQMMKGSDIREQEKKAKLFNEWEKFMHTDGESIESYYHYFMQLMNDLKRNKHFPKNIKANLKFLSNLQPEWKRHVTIVRQTKNLHEADFTQIYDFLKMNQDEVNELRIERLAKNS
nr:hypothetical protein [Tanacetum cinerariifolium]